MNQALAVYTVIAGWLLLAAGWVTNIIWTFQQDTTANILLGILGALIAPIGAIHGIWTWF